MRAFFGALLRLPLRPPVLGALYVLGLVVRAASRSRGDDAALGKKARQITQFVEGQFGGEIARMVIAIVGTSVVVGAVLGGAAGLFVRLRDDIARRPPRKPFALAAASLVVIAIFHTLILLFAMAEDPQLYAEHWYAQGGVSRTVQVLATDTLGTTGVLLVGALLAFGFLVAPAKPLAKWPDHFRSIGEGFRDSGGRIGLTALAASVAAFAVVLAAHKPSRAAAIAVRPPAPKEGQRMNVLILAADSLRADRIDARTAPNLVALAERGTRFDRAYISVPRTFSSWCSILTGRHAHHHGVRSMFPRWEDREKNFDAIPQRLAKEGYATGVVSDYAGDIFSRVDLGFAVNDTPAFDFRQLVRQRALEMQTPLLPFIYTRTGRRVFPVVRELGQAADPSMLTADAMDAIHGFGDKPFFLTVFYSTAHFPYSAPAPFYRKFTDPNYRGRYKYYKPVGLGHEAAPDAADVKQVHALYDGAVASIDDAIGQLLETLRREGKASNTIVVITADHGETLFDYGHGQGHGDHLFGDEATHVPLIIVDPRRGGFRETRIVRDVDIAPTLYELTGTTPPSDLDGRSLVPALEGKPLAPAFAYAETELWFTEDIQGVDPSMRLPYPGIERLTEVDPRHHDELVLQKAMAPLTLVARHRMIRDERWKLLYVPTRSGVKYMLFDTEKDALEQTDVADQNPEVLARMKSELWSWMLKDPDMVERNGFLVPRDLSRDRASTGIRLGDAPAMPMESPGAEP